MGKIITSGSPAIARAAQALRDGELVAFPTETVYGLGADATNDEAVAAIFAAKGRPSFNPLIVHVADIAAAEQLGQFNDTGRLLAEKHWPGPLTLVVPRRADCDISDLVSAGLTSIAIRVPGHPIAQELLRTCTLPIAAPSANRSGHVSPTTAAHVADDLGDSVALIVDGGPCSLGLESTVIDVTSDTAVVLRPGGLPHDDTGNFIQRAASQPVTIANEAPATAPRSPGLLASHYAPRAALRLNVIDVLEGEALLAFGGQLPAHSGPAVNLSKSGDLAEAAANLFAALRQLDAGGAAQIAVMPIPTHGLGEAINDRLHRAAAPRPS